jgi:dTDP-4-dehydrorhamnose 3,5-epimerase
VDGTVSAPITFVQDNHSRSSRGVLRGLHYQLEPEPQGKLVRCPVGFAHGFLTLSGHVEVLYKASGFWSKTCERSLRWNDPEVGITWPLEALGISGPVLAEAVAAGEVFE